MIGKIIKDNIEYRNLTQKEVAILANISEVHLSYILSDKELLTPSTSSALGMVFGFEPLELFQMQEKKRFLSKPMTKEEQVILEYSKSMPELRLVERQSLRLLINKFFPTSDLEIYKKYLSTAVVGFKKYKDKPLAYLWIALMEKKYGLTKSTGKFKKSSKSTIYKNVLEILLSNDEFSIRLDKLKEYLSNAGIILAEGPFIPDSTIGGVSLQRGNQRYIFISDMNKREYWFILTLMHELIHYYENFDENHEDEIDAYAQEIISSFMNKYNFKNKDLEMYLRMVIDNNLDFETLHNKTKSKINFNYVELFSRNQ